MRHYDVIIIGAGIIGLSLGRELRKSGLSVLIVERGQPGREASWAAGGMLVASGTETAPALQALATASCQMYPEFVHELEDESGLKIDFRSEGTLLFPEFPSEQDLQSAVAWQKLEPNLYAANLRAKGGVALHLEERCVDPRDLIAAAIAAARHREVDFSSGDEVLSVQAERGTALAVRTNKTSFAAGTVVNCAGAWAGQFALDACPVRPVKGQMLSVVMPEKDLLRHVIRTPKVYLIPRSDGRLVIGATAEEAGFDKRVIPETIQKLRQSALALVPKLSEARILEAWAGLRPGTPDGLPILGATATPGYFAATGHFRDGILLAPITAKLMAEVICGNKPTFDLSTFSPTRFAATPFGSI